MFRTVFVLFVTLSTSPIPLFAQQYPLTTESAQILDAGKGYAEIGFGRYFDQPYPLSGLEGTLTKIGDLRFGYSYDGNVELQFNGTLLDVLKVKSREQAFNSAITTQNSVTADVGDFTLWTKFRLISEYHFFSTVSVRFGVQLPNASNESGLGVDEFDFYSSLLLEKHYEGVRFVINAGLGILGNPAILSDQHDTFIYAFGSYVPVGDMSNLVLEVAGRTGHRGIGAYRLATAKAGGQTVLQGFTLKLLGVMSFTTFDNSTGAELVIGHDFKILSNNLCEE
ncbi:MAG TPA: hypothetical protein VMM58_11110 [Bacteroidota bacterium]|nr:hypothetical protein [Bacteroidota bacterium]